MGSEADGVLEKVGDFRVTHAWGRAVELHGVRVTGVHPGRGRFAGSRGGARCRREKVGKESGGGMKYAGRVSPRGLVGL